MPMLLQNLSSVDGVYVVVYFIITKHQMTLDGFGFVKTKQRYEIHIFYCISLYDVVPWVLKHNTELTPG